MQVKDTFVNRLENQIEYIAKDSLKAARKFKDDLLNKLND